MKLRSNLRRISIHFKHDENFNCENLLFPYVWLKNPRKTNPHYKEIIEKNNDRITKILKCVCMFVKDTKRFKKEKYKL